MKIIVSMVCAAALAVATFGMAVCAAPSPTQEVPTVSSATSNGTAVQLEVESADAYMTTWEADEAIPETTVSLLKQMVNNTVSTSAALKQMFGNASAVTTTAGPTIVMSAFAMR